MYIYLQNTNIRTTVYKRSDRKKTKSETTKKETSGYMKKYHRKNNSIQLHISGCPAYFFATRQAMSRAALSAASPVPRRRRNSR